MAAPEYVPVSLSDQPRQDEPAKPPDSWRAERPADLTGPQPLGRGLGYPGPDQGYALLLARRIEPRLGLADGERNDDAVAGAVAVALKRASIFGRAPVIHDLEFAFALFGFLGGAPDDLVAFRRTQFEGARHHYWDQRAIVDLVPYATLRLTSAQVKERIADWRSLLNLQAG
jgi:hypothetical protein